MLGQLEAMFFFSFSIRLPHTCDWYPTGKAAQVPQKRDGWKKSRDRGGMRDMGSVTGVGVDGVPL